MSWNATIPATPKDEFAAAVDACVTVPPEDQCADEVCEQIAVAREGVKLLAEKMGHDESAGFAASIGGHACTEPGASAPDEIAIRVHGVAGE